MKETLAGLLQLGALEGFLCRGDAGASSHQYSKRRSSCVSEWRRGGVGGSSLLPPPPRPVLPSLCQTHGSFAAVHQEKQCAASRFTRLLTKHSLILPSSQCENPTAALLSSSAVVMVYLLNHMVIDAFIIVIIQDERTCCRFTTVLSQGGKCY